MAELATLTKSAGAVVVDSIVQSRPRADAATLIGSGKVDDVRGAIQLHGADVAIFDNELSPTQQRNLEKALDIKILDRTQLILDIFARRARTREGQLQVELAQLNYMLPRLTGRGVEMSRLGGGIGTRGPGETQLETDRRRIFRRIRQIEKDLAKVRSTRLRSASSAPPSRSPPWRWSATPTPANPPCSTRSPARTSLRMRRCSPHSIPRCAT